MLIGKFTALIAGMLFENEKTAAIFVRELLNAGFLTAGARGVNAPHMTHMDAARLIIAALATDRPSRAVEQLERFRLLKDVDGNTAEWGVEQALRSSLDFRITVSRSRNPSMAITGMSNAPLIFALGGEPSPDGPIPKNVMAFLDGKDLIRLRQALRAGVGV